MRHANISASSDLLLNPAAVMFDLDGTLVDTMDLHFECWSEALAEFGVFPNKQEFFEKEGKNLSELARDYLGTEVSADKISSLLALKDRLFVARYKFELFDGAKDFIDLLIAKKIKTGIVTAGTRERFYKSVPPWFVELFDVFVFGDSTVRGKPHPDPYMCAFKACALEPTKGIVLENAPLGIEAAQKSGAYCVAIASTLPEQKLKKADITISKFSDIQNIQWGF
jgi:beta-phosphoglucomutase